MKHVEIYTGPLCVFCDRAKALFWNGHSENGERVASGIYYIKFIADEVIQICQLAIVK